MGFKRDHDGLIQRAPSLGRWLAALSVEAATLLGDSGTSVAAWSVLIRGQWQAGR